VTGPRVRLYSRPGCHLCDEARSVIAAVCADLATSAELLERYGEQIPVTCVDGAQHDFWRVDPDRLRAALTG
jgi:hypothetical protein